MAVTVVTALMFSATDRLAAPPAPFDVMTGADGRLRQREPGKRARQIRRFQGVSRPRWRDRSGRGRSWRRRSGSRNRSRLPRYADAATFTFRRDVEAVDDVNSSALPPSVTARPFVCVPLFAGFWMNSMLLAASSVYSVVTPPESD